MCLFDACGRISRRGLIGAAIALPLAVRAQVPVLASVVRRPYFYYRGATRIEGYLAFQQERANAPVVTVMHGNAGLPADVRETADWLAQLGYVAFAANPTTREPDPRMIPPAMLRGREFGDRYIADTRAGLAQIRREGVGRDGPIGLVGYCGGGYCGLLWNDTPHRAELGVLVGIHVALHNFNADGSIATERPQGMDLYQLMLAPAQFHYGTADRLTPERDIAELRESATRLGRTLEIHGYADADHGFAMATDDTYRADYAIQVRERAAAFLARHLH